MKISVIVCAAGKGVRAGFDRNKLLVPFMGANALYYTVAGINRLAPLLERNGDSLGELIITATPRDMAEITAVCAPFGGKTVEGGSTRTESVYNALKCVTGDIVLIQDGARPFTSVEQYIACIESVKEFGSGVTAMPSTDTVVVANGGWIDNIPVRNTVFAVQTPQGFYSKDIKSAYDRAMADGGEYTDDGSVYSRYISPARICPHGSAANRKLTFKEDFDGLEAKAVSAVKTDGCAIGYGVDVHAFGKKQDFITLCGVKVPCDEGLIAHSDGDVALHAVMDAILSAAGLRDIGRYFPDSDPAYRGADSGELLKKVVALIGERGYVVDGLSIAVQAEKPRLSPHIDGMISRVQQLTGASRERVAIAAGTCEGLGYVGEKRGICVYCVAALKNK